MKVEVSEVFNASREEVFEAVSNIANAEKVLSSVVSINIIEKPKRGLIGTKWKETRIFFGREASEVMWISDALNNEWYDVLAESHGTKYHTRVQFEDVLEGTKVTMIFGGQPQTFMAKIMSGFFKKKITGSIVKALAQDLKDLKASVESRQTANKA